MALGIFRKTFLLLPKEVFIWSGVLKLDWFSVNKQYAFTWWHPGKNGRWDMSVGKLIPSFSHFLLNLNASIRLLMILHCRSRLAFIRISLLGQLLLQ